MVLQDIKDYLFIYGSTISSIFSILGALSIYFASSYGTFLLAKKYEPQVNSILCFLPVINLYPLVKVSKKPTWWLLLLLVPLINIFALLDIFYGVTKRTNHGFGIMVLFIFFSPIVLLWLGLEASNKNKIKVLYVTIGIMILYSISVFFGIRNLDTWSKYGEEDLTAENVLQSNEVQQALEQIKDKVK